MKHISILIPFGHTSVVNIEGAHQIFSFVNKVLNDFGKVPVVNVQLVGLSKEVSQRRGMFTINPDVLINDVKKTDLIIIPAIHGDPKIVFEQNKEFVPWILNQYKSGAEVASFCIGSFFLANTGLLNGKPATTHWGYANEFRKMFPEVNVLDEKIMTEKEGVYTSGGAYSYLNLILYLIEKHVGREIAVLIAKSFMIDIDKKSQSSFIIFKGQKSHDDNAIKKAQDYIEANYKDKITVDKIASIIALSRRNFERRFKKATANTVLEYIQRVKIEAAKLSLESARENINEVMQNVGYSDPKAFRVTFKKITGLSPIDYRKKYSKEVNI
ncbi:MAG: helix-turn-helix domain-containing protein [Ignavibacteriales bacterium]|nr:helix-turn-helix domain-containing protein [Ignavibacteriales bacterium]MBP9119686.1 helix-turn-helix domain-containing protein [Ignavibacterium sp.]